MQQIKDEKQTWDMQRLAADVNDEISVMVEEYSENNEIDEYLLLEEELYAETPSVFVENDEEGDGYPPTIPPGIKFKIIGVDSFHKFYAQFPEDENGHCLVMMDETFNLSLNTSLDIYNILRRQLKK